MKQLERICNQSAIAPNNKGSKNPPSPPARPTMPVTTPMFSGKSSATYLNVDAMPNANIAPNTNSSSVNSHTGRSEEHTSELQSLMRISYAVFCLKKKTKNTK